MMGPLWLSGQVLDAFGWTSILVGEGNHEYYTLPDEIDGISCLDVDIGLSRLGALVAIDVGRRERIR